MQNIRWKSKAGQSGRALLAVVLAAQALFSFWAGSAGAAQLLTEPADQAAVVGQTVTLAVVATGVPPLTYQWYYDDNPIPGATNAVLTLPNVQFSQGGAYFVVATDANESVTSRDAHLSVSYPTGWNRDVIEIPGDGFANPYPSIIRVSGMTGVVSKVIVSLSRLTSENIEDTRILLVGPGGQSVLLLNNVGNGEVYSDFVASFDDDAGGSLPRFGPVPSGTFKPSGGSLSVFNGTNPNGYWGLFVVSIDDETLDGEIRAGWGLTLIGPTGGTIGATRYVNLNNPTPLAPYTTWATAATNIQDAIDAATAGDEIVVTNGVYATGGKSRAVLTNRVDITESLTVRSVNGAAETVIEGYRMPGTTNGDNSVRCAYLANGATLMGFTLTNGATRDWIADGIGGNGGAAWCESTNAVIADCVIIGNHAAWVGGGVFRGTLNRCTLTSNSSEGGGGGAYGTVLNNCALVGNAAWWNSGGGASYSVLNGCVLTDNTAVIFGGGASDCVLNNCTVTGNSVSGSSATEKPDNGLFGYGGGVTGCMLNDCIVYYNRAQRGANYGDPAYFGGTFTFTCTTPLPAEGTGNFDAEPQLGSASHLSATSPCRASGNGAFAMGLDIDGELWASPPSIGADQYRAGSVTGPLAVAIRTPWTNVAVGFSLEMKALIDGRTVASQWDFADGTTVSNQPYPTHRWLSPGQYAVTLTAFNESQTGGIMTTVPVQVVESTQYVNVNNPSPAPPYASWATAATNIQDAVDAAAPGGEVVVTDGVYAFGGRVVHAGLTNRVAATKPLTIRSVNGPGVTIIRGNQDQGGTNGLGASAVRGVYLANGVALIGFTVTNGATLNDCCEFPHALGGGVYCESVAATVADCTIIGNHALGGGGVYSGRVNNSSLVRNLAIYDGGGASESVLILCTLECNEAEQGGGAIFSTVSACLIATNSAAWGGGLYGSSIISESRVIGNHASIAGGGAVSTDMTDDTVIWGNSAPTGGGVFGGRLDDCDLINNSALLNGGGAFAADLLNCRLAGNVAGGDGGGAASIDANNPVTLRYCYVTGNVAGGFGGGLSSGYAESCLITGNQATNGVGGGGATATLVNCTVVGNSAYLCGGVWGGAVTNCIVYHNTISQPESAFANFDSEAVTAPGGTASGGSTPYYTCTTPLPGGGAGNITNEPVFVDMPGGNLRLQSNSPCINAGRNASVAGATNLDGPYRISGGTVDMGAYEFLNPASTLSYAWLLEHGLPLDGSADTADPDGDLFDNYHEWRASTDPTNPLSLLRLLPPIPLGAHLAVTWQSVLGRSYVLEGSTDLGATPRFLQLASGVAAKSGTNTTTFTHANAAIPGPWFYRVRVEE